MTIESKSHIMKFLFYYCRYLDPTCKQIVKLKTLKSYLFMQFIYLKDNDN